MQLTEITTQIKLKMVRPVGFEPTSTGKKLNKINLCMSLRAWLERVTCRFLLDRPRNVKAKTILLLFAALVISGCGQDGEKLPSYSPEVKKWTAYGDSTMWEMGLRWNIRFADTEPIANYGISGSTIDLFLAYPDPYHRDRVIIMSGVNNLGAGQTVDQTVAAYFKLLLTLKANRIYCVSLSPTMSATTNEKILAVNEAIRGMCGEDYYIESWDLYDPTDSLRDGLHHTDAFDRRIMDEILRRDAALPDV